MEKMIRYFAENGRVTFLLTALIFVLGVSGILNLRRESFPTVDFATMTIETAYPGASPDEVEDLITIPLENELRTVEGFDKVISVSQPGQSEITILVEVDGYESDEVMDEAQRAIQRAQLPTDILDPPRVIRVSSGEIPVFELGVTGGASAKERHRLTEDLQDLIKDVDGVANVRLNGYQEREFLIFVDQQKMIARQVSLEEISRMLSNHLRDIPGGYVENVEGKEKLVRVKGKLIDPKEIENLIVRGTFAGGQVRIRDIGRVVDGNAEAEIITRLNGQPATLMTITKKAKADTVDLVDKIEAEIEKFKSRMPEGYAITAYTNEANRVEADLNVVQINALLGLILILIVLLILLPGTIGIVASLSLPLIIFAMTFGMIVFGLTFNSITMIAAVIVLGILVDNSAVVAEGYAHNRAAGMNPVDASVKSAHAFFVPIFATVLCNFAGFAPMFVTTGIMGQFIYPIPVVITIALVFSLIETFVLLPARLKLTLRRFKSRPPEADAFDAGWFGDVQRGFHKILKALMLRKGLTMAGIIVIFISSLFVSAFLNRFELFPSDQAEYYIGRFDTELGNTVVNTDKIGHEISGQVLKMLKENKIQFNGVISFAGVSRIDAFDPQGRRAHNVGFVLITIPEEESMRISSKWLVTELKKIKAEGITQVRWTELVNGPPVGRPLNLIFRSADEKQLAGMVDDFRAELAKIPGAEDIEDDRFRTAQELNLNLNEDLLRRSNMSIAEVGAAVQTALQGTIVSKINLRSREVFMRVRFDGEDRKNFASVEKVTLATQDGGYVWLKDIASIGEVPGPVVRKRYDYQRAINVTSDVDPTKTTSVELNAKSRQIVANLMAKYPMVTYEVGGEEEKTQESFASLMTALLISIFAIMGILVFLYNSYSQSLLVLSTIPLGLAGVSYVFWIAGLPLSFMALIGVIGLGGVVVNASIVLVTFINEARAAQSDRPIFDVICEVTALRFKAVFITNATTIMGLIPTAYGLGGNDPFLMPLTLAMGWGLLLGSALAIVWVPVGYLFIEELHRRFKKSNPSRLQVSLTET